MPVAALESVDHVLPDLKQPEMFATLALLRFGGSSEAEYAVAGHPPILHYRHCSRDTARLSMEQLPLGLIPGGSYNSKRVIYSPRDLFLMVTDGITEVANAKDEEFGLTRLQELLTRYATRALPEIWGLIMREVRQYGLQQDDQSLLLLARAGPAIPLSLAERKRGRRKPEIQLNAQSASRNAAPVLHAGFSRIMSKPEVSADLRSGWATGPCLGPAEINRSLASSDLGPCPACLGKVSDQAYRGLCFPPVCHCRVVRKNNNQVSPWARSSFLASRIDVFAPLSSLLR